MKKTTVITIALTLLLAITACKKKAEQTTQSEATSQTETATPAPAKESANVAKMRASLIDMGISTVGESVDITIEFEKNNIAEKELDGKHIKGTYQLLQEGKVIDMKFDDKVSIRCNFTGEDGENWSCKQSDGKAYNANQNP